MKNIFVIPNPQKDEGYTVTTEACKTIKACGGTVFMLNKYSESKIDCKYSEDYPTDTELILVIGGDGSFIDASVYAIEHNVPILGINMGKVGYLSEIAPDNLEKLKDVFCGRYRIKEELLLSTSITKNDDITIIPRLAVNDVVVSHASYIGISDFVVYSNDGGIRYRADGAVISTPAGSTAYSLSAGGPIVSHGADAIIVTPIAPHSFFNRSIVFGANETIKIKNTEQSAMNVTVDGRLCAVIESGEKCTVTASDKKIKVLTFKDNNMFSNLFSKMQILEDII